MLVLGEFFWVRLITYWGKLIRVLVFYIPVPPTVCSIPRDSFKQVYQDDGRETPPKASSHHPRY